MNKHLIIDFDSTLVKVEAFDMLAEKYLENSTRKKEVVEKFKEITNLGMNGEITFPESLKRRIALVEISRDMVREVAIRISENISDSIKENISFFGKNRENIYIISGGFKDLILPTARKLEILDSNIMANELLFNKEGNFVDINKDNLMAQEKGKVKQMKKMDLGKDVFMVGDGWTDYETKESGVASKFVAFVENVRREKILEKADLVAENFYQVIEYVENN